MCNAMNPGWAFTFLALVYVALIAVVVLVMQRGMKWRQQLEEQKRLKVEKEQTLDRYHIRTARTYGQ
jgi:Tfp pilus assembly protein PilO